MHLLEKYLPHDGKYKDAEYDIQWLNLPTGAQLNTEVLADRLDIVQMADFPAIVGHSSFLASKSGVKTLCRRANVEKGRKRLALRKRVAALTSPAGRSAPRVALQMRGRVLLPPS